MVSYLKFVAIILVLAIVVYLIVRYVYGKATISDVAPDLFDLSQEKIVYSSDDTKTNILLPGGSSVMTFVNVNLGERTANLDTAYQSIIGVNGSFSLDISPTSSQLSISTSDGITKSVETVEIPALPIQKWVFVSILRDGRRFDIMYDDQIVASHRCNNYPVITTSPLIIGNKKLLGKGIHVLIASSRLTPTEVTNQRQKLADMNGKPVGTDTAFGLPPIPFTGIRSICFPGIPCDNITSPPGDALKAWSTPFS